ncbi:MAG: PDR/VanB family oxidoreductase [Pseudaminobacter sp.]
MIEARLTAIRYAARDIRMFEFAKPDASPLPSTTPGAHIDLHLANGMVRQYSLVETGDAPSCYTVAVKREANSRGGSSFLFDQMKVGSIVSIGKPRNNFPLDESAAESIFIAGGIGITPVHAMMRRLSTAGRPWSLYYACRTREEMPALELMKPAANVHLHLDDEAGGRFLDLGSIVRDAPTGAHLYCCGPLPMLAAFEEATREWPSDRVHVEYFAAKDVAKPSGGFKVRLARSNREYVVPEGQTILQVLRQAGLDVAFSCEEGICGACETPVLSGIPEHHDAILTEKERAANDTMMICCGGAKSDTLVLDL